MPTNRTKNGKLRLINLVSEKNYYTSAEEHFSPERLENTKGDEEFPSIKQSIDYPFIKSSKVKQSISEE